MKKIKNEMIKVFLLSGVGLIIIMFILYKAVAYFLIQQEIQKARLLSHTLVYTRDYLAKLAPYTKLVNKKFHPFALTPAYTVSKISLIIAKKEHMYVKQTSDNYRNPKNKPDEEELKAIEEFKYNKRLKDLFHITRKGEKEYVFYAYPLKIEKSCLKCHGVPYKDVPPKLYKKLVEVYGNRGFNYKEGDVRGLIAVRIPFSIIRHKINSLFYKLLGVIIVIYLIGVYLFLKINKEILNDINTIKNFLDNTISNNKFRAFKSKLHFDEFDIVKGAINNSVKTVKNFQKNIYNNLHFDSLTRMPNRKKLNLVLKRREFAIVILNIDSFKEVNYYYGEEIGNKLIRQIAKRLKAYKAFHVYIDEFVILFDNSLSRQKLEKEVEKLLCHLEKPYYIDEFMIIVKFRAGVAYQNDMMCAISALDATKLLQKDVVFCEESEVIRNEYKNHLLWLKKLKMAIENNSIIPFYQPIVNNEKKVCKYEALVRLIDENGKIVPPVKFLEIAKKSRMYFAITKIMVEKTFEKFEGKNIEFSINLTTFDMENEEIKNFLIDKIKNFSSPKLINFEIVESEDIKRSSEAKEFIKTLKSYGCKILIDDFGSGYANFDYLLSLNADGIKIDGSLVKNILEDKSSQIILKTILKFAKDVNMQVIAEFVENDKIFEYLKSLGVDCYQGYFYSPPKENIEI